MPSFQNMQHLEAFSQSRVRLFEHPIMKQLVPLCRCGTTCCICRLESSDNAREARTRLRGSTHGGRLSWNDVPAARCFAVGEGAGGGAARWCAFS